MLVRARKGSTRAKDVHPLQWWIMSESARLKASETWKAKLNEMKLAIRKRVTPRGPLDAMPVATPALLFSNASIQHSIATINGGGEKGVDHSLRTLITTRVRNPSLTLRNSS